MGKKGNEGKGKKPKAKESNAKNSKAGKPAAAKTAEKPPEEPKAEAPKVESSEDKKITEKIAKPEAPPEPPEKPKAETPKVNAPEPSEDDSDDVEETPPQPNTKDICIRRCGKTPDDMRVGIRRVLEIAGHDMEEYDATYDDLEGEELVEALGELVTIK